MSLIDNWIEDVVRGTEIQRSNLYKEISFLKDFNQIDFLITLDDMKCAIADGNLLSLDQYFEFLEEHEKFQCIEYACKYGRLDSVKWLYRHYDFWFTDECFFLASKEFNNDVFRWMLKNTEIIKMRKSDLETLVKIKNYEALGIYYTHQLGQH